MRGLICVLCVLCAGICMGQDMAPIPGYGQQVQPMQQMPPMMPQQMMPPVAPPMPGMVTDSLQAAGQVLATNPDGIEIRHTDSKIVRRLNEVGYQQGYQPYQGYGGYQQPFYGGLQQQYGYPQQGYSNQPFFWNGFWWMRDGYHLWYLNRCSGVWCVWQ